MAIERGGGAKKRKFRVGAPRLPIGEPPEIMRGGRRLPAGGPAFGVGGSVLPIGEPPTGKPPAGSRRKLRAKVGAEIGRGKRFVGEITPSPMSFFAGRPPGLASPGIPPDLEEAILGMQGKRKQLGLPPELLAPRIPGAIPPPVHTRRPTIKSPAEEERARRGIFRADIGDRLDELYRASKPEPGGEMEGPDEVADIDRPDVASSQEEYNRKWREQQAFVDRWLRNSATYELGKEAQRQLEDFMARHPEFERNRFNQAREEAGFQPLTIQQAILGPQFGPPPTSAGIPSVGAPPPIPAFEQQRVAPPPTSLLPQSGQFLPNIMPELDQNTINAMGMSGVAGLLALLLRQAPQLAGQAASGLFPAPPPGQPFIRG